VLRAPHSHGSRHVRDGEPTGMGEASAKPARFRDAPQLGAGRTCPKDDHRTASRKLPTHAPDVPNPGGLESLRYTTVFIEADQHRSIPVDHRELADWRLRRVSRRA
jgi:hypothetical protein